MTFDSYYNISVNLPKREIQNKIADVLKNIDTKIALNQAINRNLSLSVWRIPGRSSRMVKDDLFEKLDSLFRLLFYFVPFL